MAAKLSNKLFGRNRATPIVVRVTRRMNRMNRMSRMSCISTHVAKTSTIPLVTSSHEILRVPVHVKLLPTSSFSRFSQPTCAMSALKTVASRKSTLPVLVT